VVNVEAELDFNTALTLVLSWCRNFSKWKNLLKIKCSPLEWRNFLFGL
jgi:hypothetical protein